MASPADTRNGTSVPNCATKPPSAGPMMKPKPNAMPITPKFAPRFSGGVTSAI